MKRLTLISLCLSLFAGALTGCAGRAESPASSQQEPSPPAAEPSSGEEPRTDKPIELLQFTELKSGDTVVVLRTTMGDIKARLFPEKAPKAVENFIGLAEQGYYTGKIFHRVMKNFMIQGGSPNGDGIGGESIYKDENGNSTRFEDEFSMDLWHFYGALCMANSGPNTNLSQFFIVEGYKMTDELLKDMRAVPFPEPVIEKYIELGGTPHLDWHHTVFGHVIEGMDVVNAIATAPANDSKPLEDIIILSVTVEKVD